MAYKKIQPEQLQMPIFYNDLGDVVITQEDTGIRLDLSRGLTGDFNVTGGLILNKAPVLELADTSTNFYNRPESGTFVLNGANNNITNCIDSIIVNGSANTVQGNQNVVLNGSNQDYGIGVTNCTAIGNNATFGTLTTGALVLTDSLSTPVIPRGDDSLTLQFTGGAYIATINSYFLNTTVSLNENSSGIFSGGVNFYGDTFVTGYRVATTHDVTGMLSGNFVEGNGASYFAQSGDHLVFRNSAGVWTGIQTKVIP